jgi:CHAD domain-containing protein
LLPHRSIAPDITPRLTGDQAFRRILRSCGNQVLHNIAAVRESEDIEGPHQLRVGLRRLRCALKAHRPFYEKGVFKHIETEARDLAHVIGGLRDADVITDEFVAPQARNAPCEPGFKALLETLRSRRSEIRTTVRRHLASDRVRTFQLDLFALIECDSRALPHRSRRARARREPVGARASEILDTFWHKASSIGREIENLSIAERHEMRKALKNFRYVIDFYAPIYPRKAVRRYLEQLKKLQSVFGFLNDVAVLREDLSVIGPGPEPLFWAIGYLHGSNEVRADLAWAAARAHWKALTKTAAFWSQ